MAEPNHDISTLSAVPSAVASAATSGAGTPASLLPLNSEEHEKSIKVSLADLTAKATALYAQKKYDDAAEVFSQAADMQSELNGEMNPENADILFMYGRCLFKVGQSKSDVLGDKASGDKKKPNGSGQPAKKKAPAESSGAHAIEVKTEAEQIAEEKVAIVAKNVSDSVLKEGDEVSDDKKPLFQFIGDEGFADSDSDASEGEGEEEEVEEDDLAVAFSVLDLARVLFEKKLEQANAKEPDTPTIRHVKERLGDAHDLLAEISLENEKYTTAINDTRASLRYKAELLPEESEIIAEAHFKLSLALEFASVTQSEEESKDGPKAVDQDLRDEAAAELEKAIASTKLKLQNKEVTLATMHEPEDNEITRKQIAEVKDLIVEMEQRLVELRKPPVDVDSMLGTDNPMSGILGAALGESTAETEARVEEAKKNAKDLSGLVRKKDKKPEPVSVPAAEVNGKRKAQDSAEGDENKKPKVEEAHAAES